MGLSVTVLGASGTYAGAGDACSGYLVRSEELCILVDAGAGTLGELQRHIGPERLDAVLLSHSHPDHWVEAPILRNALRYVLGREGLPVYGTAETLELISEVGHEHVSPTFEMHRIGDGDEVRIGGMSVRCSRTDHPPETLAFCLDDGEHRVAYSADTGPGWDFTDFMSGGGGRSLGRPVDLAICEATFREGQGGHDPVHMTAAEAGRAAKGAEARRLVITHLLPGADVGGARAEAEDAYGAAVEVARSGLVLTP